MEWVRERCGGGGKELGCLGAGGPRGEGIWCPWVLGGPGVAGSGDPGCLGVLGRTWSPWRELGCLRVPGCQVLGRGAGVSEGPWRRKIWGPWYQRGV